MKGLTMVPSGILPTHLCACHLSATFLFSCGPFACISHYQPFPYHLRGAPTLRPSASDAALLSSEPARPARSGISRPAHRGALDVSCSFPSSCSFLLVKSSRTACLHLRLTFDARSFHLIAFHIISWKFPFHSGRIIKERK